MSLGRNCAAATAAARRGSVQATCQDFGRGRSRRGCRLRSGRTKFFRLDARHAYSAAVDSLHMTYATSAKLALALERRGEALVEADAATA